MTEGQVPRKLNNITVAVTGWEDCTGKQLAWEKALQKKEEPYE